jgi:hypothetical protein
MMPKKMEREIRYLGDLARLDIRTGDTFVLMCPGYISEEQIVHIKQTWAENFGADSKIIVIGDGCKLGVLRSDKQSDDNP